MDFCPLIFILFDFLLGSHLFPILLILFWYVVYYSSVLYLEGNLETKIFTDPVTGLVRRIQEVAIRRNGTFMIFFFHC